MTPHSQRARDKDWKKSFFERFTTRYPASSTYFWNQKGLKVWDVYQFIEQVEAEALEKAATVAELHYADLMRVDKYTKAGICQSVAKAIRTLSRQGETK